MFVSIVMPVYNGEKFLKAAITSALAQTYPHFELIVVNDGSTDGTKEILDHIEDERLRVLHLSKNHGGANALNLGIIKAKGAWIAIQDSDDNSYPTRLEEQVKYIKKNPELVGVATLVEYIGGSDISRGLIERLTKRKNAIISREEINRKKFFICDLTHSSVMFSREVFLKVGGYNTNFKILYDYDLWLRLLEQGDMEKVPKVLLQYRIHRGSLSRTSSLETANEIQIASSKAIGRLLRKHKKRQPKVIVLGPQKACENYKKHIAPVSNMKIHSLVHDQFKEQLPKVIADIKEGKADGIVILKGLKMKRILSLLKRKNLALSKDIFYIYNILK